LNWEGFYDISGIGFNPFFPYNRGDTAVGSAIGGLPYGEDQYSVFLEKGLKRVYPLSCTRLFVASCMNNICVDLGDECQHIMHRKECHDIVQSKL
jgi:hypothetical protein